VNIWGNVEEAFYRPYAIPVDGKALNGTLSEI